MNSQRDHLSPSKFQVVHFKFLLGPVMHPNPHFECTTWKVKGPRWSLWE